MNSRKAVCLDSCMRLFGGSVTLNTGCWGLDIGGCFCCYAVLVRIPETFWLIAVGDRTLDQMALWSDAAKKDYP